ncbi:MAG TPA: hypothetical protein VEY13_04880 [Rubrobacteraceae bacterium]|nr:hypothetical protein [Rubrobacteraceae bacterium]
MQYEEFIDRIRRRARLDMVEETQTASRATLTALWKNAWPGAKRWISPRSSRKVLRKYSSGSSRASPILSSVRETEPEVRGPSRRRA